MRSIKKKIILVLVFLFVYSCNYQPLFKNDSLSSSIKTVDISGNKRIAQKLSNMISKSKEGGLSLFIDAKKDTKISNKSISGKILEYKISVSFDIKAKRILDGKEVFKKNFTKEESYKASSLYSNTINVEKKIIENICKTVSIQIFNEINLSVNNQ